MEGITMLYIAIACLCVMSCSHAFECWLTTKSFKIFVKTLPVAWIFGVALAGAIIFLYRNAN
jgi:hypothetical protein